MREKNVIHHYHHVGIAVKDLPRTLCFFQETLGAKLLWHDRFEAEGFESALVSVGKARFELLASLSPGSLIDRFIKTKGEGIHHVSLEVTGFDHTLDAFKSKRLRVMGQTDRDDFKAAFLHPKDLFGVLTEIMEPKGSWGAIDPGTGPNMD